ncbi:hypothetical protein JHK84_053990 [Glycine max]|nr:hypothetical protein JHK84_053990 [Glycine max]KHN02219.1 hypothetical protein glysoja_002243 [Glycine soja]
MFSFSSITRTLHLLSHPLNVPPWTFLNPFFLAPSTTPHTASTHSSQCQRWRRSASLTACMRSSTSRKATSMTNEGGGDLSTTTTTTNEIHTRRQATVKELCARPRL